MNVDIKLTQEQHELLLARLGSGEAIRIWLEETLNRELSRMAAEKK